MASWIFYCFVRNYLVPVFTRMEWSSIGEWDYQRSLFSRSAVNTTLWAPLSSASDLCGHLACPQAARARNWIITRPSFSACATFPKKRSGEPVGKLAGINWRIIATKCWRWNSLHENNWSRPRKKRIALWRVESSNIEKKKTLWTSYYLMPFYPRGSSQERFFSWKFLLMVALLLLLLLLSRPEDYMIREMTAAEEEKTKVVSVILGLVGS